MLYVSDFPSPIVKVVMYGFIIVLVRSLASSLSMIARIDLISVKDAIRTLLIYDGPEYIPGRKSLADAFYYNLLNRSHNVALQC